jgi:hypothetical protein
MPPHVPYAPRSHPSRLYPKCNPLPSLERPWGAVSFPDEVDGDTWIWSTRRGLNLSATTLPRAWSPWESSPSMKNPRGWARNRTQDLMISSQELWQLDHEADLFSWCTIQHLLVARCQLTAAVGVVTVTDLNGNLQTPLARNRKVRNNSGVV